MKHLQLIIGFLLAIIVFSHCGLTSQNWELKDTISLGKGGCIGIDTDGTDFWISDANNNTINKYDSTFQLIKTIQGFDRPMHIHISGKEVYVPNYGTDLIFKYSENGLDTIPIPLELDAPTGIYVSKDHFAIADFYSNSILLRYNDDWKVIGQKGDKDGEFHYPTDVQILNQKIYVADAYNHRVQVFGLQGNHLKTIGEDLEMNATTGIFVTEQSIFATDLENNRVLEFDHDGNLITEIIDHLDKPSDLILVNNVLYVLNYGTNEIVLFTK